jgi:ABC-type sugar transport system ATPase subunit
LQEAARGKAILMISSELPELLLLCDVIHVIRNGHLTKSFSRENATEEKIMQAAAAD